MSSAPTPKLQHLLDGLANLKTRRNAQLALIAAAWTLVALALLLLLATVGDAFLAYPVSGRLCAFTLLALTLFAGLALCIRLAFRRFSNQAMAAIAEQACPHAENAIINAVQMHESDDGRPEIIDAIIDEHPVEPATLSARATYSRRIYSHLSYALPVALLLFGLVYGLSPERMSVALRRVLNPLADIPPFTETFIVSVTPGDITIRRGEPLTITATLDGIIPEKTIIEWLLPGTDVHDAAAMTANANEKSLSHDFPPCFDSFRYRVLSNDATSDWMTVTVDNPPGLENWEVRVVPPAYTERATYSFTAASEDREIIGGSRITFAGAASRPLSRAELFCESSPLSVKGSATPFSQFVCDAQIPYSGSFSVKLHTPESLETTLPLPIAILPDRLPVITLVETPTNVKVNRGDTVTLTFGAMDDYGIARVSLEQLLPDNKTQEITSASPTPEEKKLFRARFSLDTNTFNHDEAVLRVRLRAIETATDEPSRNGLSPIIVITFNTPKEVKAEQDRKAKNNEQSLERLLVMQRNALKLTNDTMYKAASNHPPTTEDISELYSRQKDIRDMAIAVLQNRDMLGVLGDTLAGMVNKEFIDVLSAIDALNRAGATSSLAELQKVAALQTKILALLTTMGKQGIAGEQQHQEKADIFSIIQRLAKDQNIIIKQGIAAKANGKADFAQLVKYQTGISKGLLAFNDKALAVAEEHVDDDFSAQLRLAVEALDKAKSYNHSMDAIESLDEEALDDALKSQKLALTGIAAAYKILNDWRVNNAAKTIADAKEVIDEVKEALGKMEEIQAKISEIAHELQKRNAAGDDPSLKDDMEKMEKEHEKMLDELEKLANDLYQFPDLPICNELNSKMKEIYEDVLQAKDSEKLKAVEIAVQKEDSLLDLIRSTTERIDDVEMWLPDVPDHFIWNMESFDSDEFPEMPLVELPEELQDIVGDLLEQDSEIDEQSQDTTGNNMVADMEMGWAVMDGPMPCFSAKGKSGNTRPNDNEMTGRSGAGREGQANGELVENHVKGYEGRQTHARKTNDKFQKGQVTEDKDSTMDARATGGGKLGGDSESIGMFGNAPRRDTHRGAHGTTPRQLRQETDVIFAKARLLYLNSGSMGEAVHHLSGIGKNPPDLKSFDNIRKKVLRRLSDSVFEMKEGAVLPMPVDAIVKHNANTSEQRQGEAVSDEYKSQLNNYFKSLNQ